MPKPIDPPSPAISNDTPMAPTNVNYASSYKSVVATAVAPLPSPIAAPIRSNAWGTNSSRVSPALTNDSLHTNGVSSSHIDNDFTMATRQLMTSSPIPHHVSPAQRVLSSDSSDGYSDQTNGCLGDIDLSVLGGINHWGCNGSGPGDFNPWAPISECFTPTSQTTPFPPVPVVPLDHEDSRAAPGSGRFVLGTRDAASQTDVFSEQLVLADVFKNTELLRTIMLSFPEHTERIMGMRSVWKS